MKHTSTCEGLNGADGIAVMPGEDVDCGCETCWTCGRATNDPHGQIAQAGRLYDGVFCDDCHANDCEDCHSVHLLTGALT